MPVPRNFLFLRKFLTLGKSRPDFPPSLIGLSSLFSTFNCSYVFYLQLHVVVAEYIVFYGVCYVEATL